jgi:hypothetical protein
MTPAKFATYVRYRTKTNATSFSDAELLAYMEMRQDEIAQAILKIDEDVLLIPQTTSLVLNQREYPMPSDIISRIKRVDAKLDGTKWLHLDETDITQLDFPISSETDIVNHFSNNHGLAKFDIIRKSIYILSGTIITVAGGLKVWVDTYPTPITDLTSTTDLSVDPSSTTHGIPRPMHKIWATGVIIDYKSSKEKPIPLIEREQNYELDMQNAILTLKHGNLDREVIASTPYNDGSQY